MTKTRGIPYTVSEARAYLYATPISNHPGGAIDLYPADLMRWLCDRIEELEAILNRISSHRHASAIDPGGDQTLLEVIETIERWAREED